MILTTAGLKPLAPSSDSPCSLRTTRIVSLNREPWSETRQIVAAALPGVNSELPFSVGAAAARFYRRRALYFRRPVTNNFILSAEPAATVRRDRLVQEAELVERIARAVPSAKGAGRSRDGLLVGIGDDAAILGPGRGARWVLSCDAFIEKVHFLAERHPADSVGYKALVRAASDLAAMGAEPRYFLLTLALPASRTGAWLDEFLKGMGRAAESLGMRLVGGDTTKSTMVSISVTVLGKAIGGRAVMRSGAGPGDVVFVSGNLGRAELGLRLFKMRDFQHHKRANHHEMELCRAHLYPNIRVHLGSWLARHKIASAMMDISDGLSTDLARMCAESRVGAQVWADRIPCVKLPARRTGLLRKRKFDPLQMALHGGEDYELLFTVPRRNLRKLRGAPDFAELAAIGEIVRGRGIKLVGADGRATRLEPGGWEPFARP